MSAIKLADELRYEIINHCLNSAEEEWYLEIEDMLRQQEQKIAELEKDLFMLQKHYDQLGVRELTDEEIGQFKGQWYRSEFNTFYDLVKAILKKASEE